MDRILLVAVVAAALSWMAVPAGAEGPDDLAPGQVPGQVRVGPQIPTAPEQRIDCVANPADPRCRSNPCASPTEIYGYDEATCAPCLPNSIADVTNRRCVCTAGFVQVSQDQWGRATCEAEATQPAAPSVENVLVSAPEFYRAVESVGIGHSILSVPFGNRCTVSVRPNAIRMEYFPPDSGIIAPAPYDVADRSCLVRLFGGQLQNGWEYVRVDRNAYCDHNQDYGIEITKVSNDPASPAIDIRLSAWGGPFCQVEILTVVQRGPAGEQWKRAFGH